MSDKSPRRYSFSARAMAIHDSMGPARTRRVSSRLPSPFSLLASRFSAAYGLHTTYAVRVRIRQLASHGVIQGCYLEKGADRGGRGERRAEGGGAGYRTRSAFQCLYKLLGITPYTALRPYLGVEGARAITIARQFAEKPPQGGKCWQRWFAVREYVPMTG